MSRLSKVLNYNTSFSLTETPTPLEGSRTKKPPALSLEKKKIKSIPSNLMHDDNNDIKHLRSSKTQKNKNNF